MTDLSSGKGHKDENFPVASVLLRRDARAPIMAFYRFARAADDIADHPTASAEQKLAQLAHMRAGLSGDGAAVAMALADIARERRIDLVHAQELLDAFVQDVNVSRYADWAGLLGYCRLSAMPVGRFVLDVHGEARSVWPLSDALCAALQIINHLQDCGKDYRALDRVYLPEDMLAAEGASIADLGGDHSPPELRRVIERLAVMTRALLDESAGFAGAIRDRRLAAEVAIIQALAEDLVDLLMRRDPLSDRVHHSKLVAGGLAMKALVGHGIKRVMS